MNSIFASEAHGDRSKDSRQQHVGSGERADSRFERTSQAGDHNGEFAVGNERETSAKAGAMAHLGASRCQIPGERFGEQGDHYFTPDPVALPFLLQHALPTKKGAASLGSHAQLFSRPQAKAISRNCNSVSAIAEYEFFAGERRKILAPCARHWV